MWPHPSSSSCIPRHQPGRMWARLGGGSGKPFFRWGCGWTQPAITRALSSSSTFPAVSSLSPPQWLSRGCLLLSRLDKRGEEAQCGRVTFPRLHSPDLAEHTHWSPRFILAGAGQGAARDAESCSSSEFLTRAQDGLGPVPSTLRTTPQQLSQEKESELLIPAPSDLTLMPGDVFFCLALTCPPF